MCIGFGIFTYFLDAWIHSDLTIKSTVKSDQVNC